MTNTTRESVDNVLNQIQYAVYNADRYMTDFSYQTGLSGLAIFYYFLSQYRKDPSYQDKIVLWLDQSIQTIDPQRFEGLSSIFYRELAHLGIAISYIKKHDPAIIKEYETILHIIDKLLLQFLQRKIVEKDLNPLTGALVAGHYLLWRLDTMPSMKKWLKKLVLEIERLAETTHSGSYYWRWPVWKSEGVYLGMTCGSAAILNFLADSHKKEICQSRCIDISQKACQYVLEQKRDFPASYFPIIAGEKVTTCSLLLGDLGVCYGLLRASQTLTDRRIMNETLFILKEVCKRKHQDQTLVRDASIQYGASGVAILYREIYNATGNALFKRTAEYWYQRIVQYQLYNNEFAGFKAFFNQKYSHTNASFNEGIIGIGLALMSYADDTLPPLFPLVYCI